MKQYIAAIFFVCLLVLILGVKFFFLNPQTQNSVPLVKIGSTEIKVSLAQTPQQLSKGLGGVEHLDDNHGMLFVFPQQNTSPSFWMKDMTIGLDMIWINDSKVVHISKDVPPPNSSQDQLPLYSANQPVDYVLEVNSGFSDNNGIEIGDSVEFIGI